jgi:hypothetical protein
MQKNTFTLFVASLIATVAIAPAAFAQEDLPAAALKKINEASVTQTVKFLASDEMAGRDTPSPEFDKACDFVAQRFKDAGLEPLGTDGSFFHKTKIATVQCPASAIVKNGDSPVKVLGVLSAGSTAFQFSGNIALVQDKTDRNATYDGPVTLVAEEFKSRRSSSNFFRKLTRLKKNGATACLVQVTPDHPLVAQAERASRPHLIRAFGSLSGPVILIEKTELKAASIKLDKQLNDSAEVKNVIGVLKGSDAELSKEAIIFSAHLDHIGISGTVGDTINNGADDDASGVTAVLTLADAYTTLPQKPKRSVIFMTFWGEEKGLLGSRHYAKDPTWPLEKTVANINLEMLGRPEAGAQGKVWMTGWDQSDLGEIMKVGADRAGVLVFDHPRFSAMLYRQSDNWSFVEKGVIAHSFSAGSLHEDYHQPSDEWEKLRLDHMTKVIHGLFAGSLPIANGSATPKKSANRRPEQK